ncbi:ATP-dependent helicase [Zavarzinia aquatilis]|uniref:ATP-dependent helicase n=1 Tax=Zavarzinia aquatilis TaxID=2211142 RepID=UPI0026D541E1
MSADPFDPAGWDEPLPPDAPDIPAPTPYYLDGLNPEQRAAVEATDGPVLVLAGAGTGKTRVLTTRIAHLLHLGKAWPGQILAVTFTNKAAREMQERVAALVPGAAEGLNWLGTFHSIAARILRRHAELVGLQPNFTILDADDQLRLMKQLIAAEGLDDKRFPARSLAVLIDRWKNRALTPDRLGSDDAHSFADGKGKLLYTAYQERLKTLNAADFGDLLLHVITIFQQHPDVLADWQRRFKYILVDEYQDTNVAQYLWLRLLAQRWRNLCCVGDDDQSIYGWRGAEVGNILKFESDFPGAVVIRLERNYRSTGHILAAASGLIAANEGRLGKTLWTEDEAGEKVRVIGYWDGEEEARSTADLIEGMRGRGRRLSEMAILVRAGHQTRAFEERFVATGLPYRVIGGPRFYERQEIRDALAYFRVVVQPDDDLAFERIVNVPKRGLGDATIQQLHILARARGISLHRAAEAITESDELKPKARTALRDLMTGFARWRAVGRDLPHAELAETILDESGYTAMWQADKSAEAPGRLDNLKELVDALAGFESLPAFLDHVALVMEIERGDAGQDMVTLMTLHGAKGLEFPVVFLPGWEEGLFPSQRSLDESGLAGLEEERRLAYVGITRARETAIISHAANRRIYNQWQSAIPSRFIDEMPRDHVEIEAKPGLWGANSGSSSLGTSLREADLFGDRGAPGPGFRRAAEVKPTRALDLAVERVTVTDHSGDDFSTGERVFHQKFGYGRIARIEGNKLDINFDKAGVKKVIASFVSRA